MLAEFAFTPSIFDETAHRDSEAWREQLRELGSNMFPRTAAWPVMISNLYAGSWESIASSVVKAIKDPKARVLCEHILTNAAKTLVHRPAKGDWPGEEALDWGREALTSNVDEPIDRIVACKPAHEILSKESRFVRCIDEVQDSGFWKDVESPWAQTMRINAQVDSLRKLCVHAEFLCLVTPHINGGSDDETDFALEMIRSSFHRPADYASPEIEIHTEAPANPGSSDFPDRLRKFSGNVTGSIRSILAPGHKVRLVLWPRLLDRYVLAGIYSEMPDSSKGRSPRWGVSMPHIARRADERASKPPTPWSLLTRSQLLDEFDRYCKSCVTGFVHAVDVVR